MRPLLLASALALGIAAAQTPPQSGPMQLGGGVTAPFVFYKVEPEYSDEARIARLAGAVVLSATVTPEGLPTNFHVVRSLGLGLDEKAFQAVSGWRFKPGMKFGNPVAVQVTLEVNFRLFGSPYQLDPRTWHLTRAAFDTFSSAPRLVEANYPANSASFEHATVSLSFDVDETGLPINILAVKSSDRKWEPEAIAILRQWRFKPDGRPVVVHAAFDFARGN
jgi:TonB family protein